MVRRIEISNRKKAHSVFPGGQKYDFQNSPIEISLWHLKTTSLLGNLVQELMQKTNWFMRNLVLKCTDLVKKSYIFSQFCSLSAAYILTPSVTWWAPNRVGSHCSSALVMTEVVYALILVFSSFFVHQKSAFHQKYTQRQPLFAF